MAWKFRCKEFKVVREEMDKDSPDSLKIMKAIQGICEKYAKAKWDYADDFKELGKGVRTDIEGDEDGDLVNGESADYWLNELYDLCDNARVWLEVG